MQIIVSPISPIEWELNALFHIYVYTLFISPIWNNSQTLFISPI